MRRRLIIISLILLSGITIYDAKLLASENTKQQELLYTIKNHDALPEDRKAALKQLADNPTNAFRKILIELLQNQREARVFQQFIVQSVITMKDPEFYSLLKKKAADKKTDSYLRQVSISILWKQNSESILPLMLAIAEDPFETFFFRSKVMQYLIPIATKPEVKDAMTKILKDIEESSQIKKLALNVLEKSGDSKTVQSIYQDIVSDQSRSTGEREEALRKIEAESPSLLEERLFKILDDTNEKPELKKIAIQKISGNKTRLKAVLPQLKRLERMGPLVGIDGALREMLRNLVEETEQKMLAEQSNQEDLEQASTVTSH